jgi:hypothetical protein
MLPMAGTCLLTLALLADAPIPPAAHPKRPSLNAEETALPKRVGGKLCHDAVGFTIDDPGPDFRERPGLGGGGGHVRLWLWENDQQERLDIMVLKGTGETPEDFREFASGMGKGEAEESEIGERTIDTTRRPYVATLDFHFRNGGSRVLRCIGTKADRGTPWTFCVSTVARDPTTFRALRESLAAGACPR